MKDETARLHLDIKSGHCPVVGAVAMPKRAAGLIEQTLELMLEVYFAPGVVAPQGSAAGKPYYPSREPNG